MKHTHQLMVVLLGIFLIGCGDPQPVPQPDDQNPSGQQPSAQNPSDDTEVPDEIGPAPTPDADGVQHFGAPFALDTPPTALAEALPRAEELLGNPIKVAGTVKTSCRKKGCWMQLEPIAEDAPAMRVTFKDYGFFVPLHSDGAQAVIEGEFVKQVMDEATRRHFAEDAGQTPEEIEAIVGDVEVIAFVATGVDMTGLSAQEE